MILKNLWLSKVLIFPSTNIEKEIWYLYPTGVALKWVTFLIASFLLIEDFEEVWKNPSIESFYLVNRWKSQDKKDFLDLGCGLGRHSH